MKKLFLKILAWKLKILARLIIKRYQPGILGVTGSVGKTSTKEAIKTVLSEARRVRGSSKNFNNDIGLPLAILGDWQETADSFLAHLFFWPRVFLKSFFNLFGKKSNYPEILVLEYGIDRPGDMDALLEIARPSIGVITALGEIPAHVEFFAGAEAVAKEKEKLINRLPATGFAILNADDVVVMNMKDRTRAHVVTFGFAKEADMRITNFEEHFDGREGGVSFKLNYGGSFVPVRLNGVFGKTQSYAAAAAALAGLIFGMNLVKISEALTHYRAPAGRLRIIPGIKGSTIIDDTYNSSPTACHEALDVLRRLKAKRKIAVLGDMLELGRYTMAAHHEVGRLAAKVVDLLITVGLRAKFIAEGAIEAGMAKKSVVSFQSVREAGLFLQEKISENDLILVKGSQGVRMERIVLEVMAEPQNAAELLVRQSPAWQKIKGLYD